MASWSGAELVCLSNDDARPIRASQAARGSRSIASLSSSQHDAELMIGVEIVTSRGSVAKVIVPPHVSVRPVSVGSAGEIEIEGDEVAPKELFLLMVGGRVLAASAHASKSAPTFATRVERRALPRAWTPVEMPCWIEVGSAKLRLFWCAPRRSGARRVAKDWSLPRALPVPKPPPRRDSSTATTIVRQSSPSFPRQEVTERLPLPKLPPSISREATLQVSRDSSPSSAPTVVRPLDLRTTRPSHPAWAPNVPEAHSSCVRPVAPRPPEGVFFRLASRAVDAWNRIVDEIDEGDRLKQGR